MNTPGTYTVTAISEAGCPSVPQTMVVNSTAPQSCTSPDMLSNYNTTFDEATVSWNPAITADSFLVEYTRISDNTTATVMVPGNTSQVTLSDLTQGEQYKWIVYAVCGVNQNGSSIKQFETLSGPLPCGSTPQGTDVLLVNSTFARVAWLPAAADDYVIRYREVGTSIYKHKRIPSSQVEKMIFGLTPSTTYEWSIKSICNGFSSLYSGIDYFTTLDVCPSIGNVTVTETGFNTAELSWNIGVVVDTLMIKYEVAGSNEFTVIKISGDPNPGNYMITGLQPETTYNAWVSTKCSSGSTSMWGTGVSFTTHTEPTVRYSSESGLMHLNAYPNPTRFQINYVFESQSSRPYTVKVSDMAGKILFIDTRVPNEGLTGEKVPLAGFASGMYMLIIQQGPVVGRFRFNIHE